MSANANQRFSYKPLTDNSQLTPRTPHTSRTGRPVQTFADAQGSEDEEDIIVGGNTTSSGARAPLPKTYREQDETQSYPLLRSATSHTFPPTPAPSRPAPRAHRTKRKWSWNPLDWDFKHIAETTPLIIGGIGACILLILILLSVNKPEILRTYILKTNGTIPIITTSGQSSSGGTTGEEHGEMTRLMEYENSCWKMMDSGEMKHGGPYWGEHHQHTNPVQANEQVVQEDDDDYDPFDDSDDGPETASAIPAGTCRSTITYVLDGNVGLFYDLALLAQTAALAREVS